MEKKRVGILGATGYTGLELLRIFSRHPYIEVAWLTSESNAGCKLSSVARVTCDYDLLSLEQAKQQAAVDYVFVCLPHTTAMQVVPHFLGAGARVIDLSADFRLKNAEAYKLWYQHDHLAPEYLTEAVYGLSELYKKQIKAARLIANPGCFPTSILLPLIPLFQAGVLSSEVIIDSKSSISGAGRSAKVGHLFCEINENMYPYSIGHNHRHLAEIEEQLEMITKASLEITFAPHVLPINRGILSTIYVKGTSLLSEDRVRELWRERYADCQFISILSEGALPALSLCAGSNQALMAVTQVSANRLIITSAIDNLVKGASGQAVQNFNIMCGFPEEVGLR